MADFSTQGLGADPSAPFIEQPSNVAGDAIVQGINDTTSIFSSIGSRVATSRSAQATAARKNAENTIEGALSQELIQIVNEAEVNDEKRSSVMLKIRNRVNDYLTANPQLAGSINDTFKTALAETGYVGSSDIREDPNVKAMRELEERAAKAFVTPDTQLKREQNDARLAALTTEVAIQDKMLEQNTFQDRRQVEALKRARELSDYETLSVLNSDAPNLVTGLDDVYRNLLPQRVEGMSVEEEAALIQAFDNKFLEIESTLRAYSAIGPETKASADVYREMISAIYTEQRKALTGQDEIDVVDQKVKRLQSDAVNVMIGVTRNNPEVMRVVELSLWDGVIRNNRTLSQRILNAPIITKMLAGLGSTPAFDKVSGRADGNLVGSTEDVNTGRGVVTQSLSQPMTQESEEELGALIDSMYSNFAAYMGVNPALIGGDPAERVRNQYSMVELLSQQKVGDFIQEKGAFPDDQTTEAINEAVVKYAIDQLIPVVKTDLKSKSTVFNSEGVGIPVDPVDYVTLEFEGNGVVFKPRPDKKGAATLAQGLNNRVAKRLNVVIRAAAHADASKNYQEQWDKMSDQFEGYVLE